MSIHHFHLFKVLVGIQKKFGKSTLKILGSLPQEFTVLGINDYLFIDGYEKVLEYKVKGGLKNITTIFPVIEFRIKKFGDTYEVISAGTKLSGPEFN